MINLKLINTNASILINICDSNLIGKEINDVKISEYYYGKPASREEVITALKQATAINALGQESIDLLCSVHKGLEIIEIDEIPHAQLFAIT